MYIEQQRKREGERERELLVKMEVIVYVWKCMCGGADMFVWLLHEKVY